MRRRRRQPSSRRDRPRLRRTRLALAGLLFVAGGLLVAETVLTVTWREPLTSFSTKREQNKLDRELRSLERRAAPPRELTAARRFRSERRRMAYLARSLRARASEGTALGRISIPKLGVRMVLVEGTQDETLKKGPAHYDWTTLPGEKGTVGVAGHRTTYLAPFRHLDRLRRGDAIVLEMPYGRFRYHVERTAIVPPHADEVLRRVRETRVVLTACHPPFSDAERIVVFAGLVKATPRGPALLPRARGGSGA